MPAAYDQYDYSDYWLGREYEHESEVIAIKAFLSRIPKIESVIDLGCGFGRLTQYYSFRAKKIILTDPSLKLLSEARRNNQDNQKIKYIHSRLETLPPKLHRQTFDLAILVRVLHHIEDPDVAFEAIDKILEPGGYLILEFANKIHWKEVGKNLLKGNFTYPLDIFPQDKRSAKSVRKGTIPFLNFHPDIIRQKLEERRYKIIETRSVSNVRWGYLKKHMPISFLLWLEDLLQIPFSWIKFGPSIFILARKS